MSGEENARRFLRTPGSQLSVNMSGMDEANNEDAARTDPNRILWQREYGGHIPLDPVAVPNPEGVLYNPGVTASRLYEVYFEVVNIDVGGAAIAGVYVGVGLGGAAIVAPNWWMYNETINPGVSSGRRGPYVLAGDDDIRGVAAVAGDASINFFIRRVDTGA